MSEASAVLPEGLQLDYGRSYYDEYGRLGPCAYVRENPHWLRFFGHAADEIVRLLDPHSVLDVGCAKGFFVECLRDRGVEAYGCDVSEYAVSQVRTDIRPYCWVGSATDSIARQYDLITCVEVCEHLAEADAVAAVRQMTLHSDTVLFSSTPSDFAEPTHVNVRPVIDWLRLFAEFSFAPDEDFDSSFLSPQAILFRRTDRRPADRDLCRFASDRNREIAVSDLKYDAGLRNQLESILNSRSWRLLCKYRALRFRVKHAAARLLEHFRCRHSYSCWMRRREQRQRRTPPATSTASFAYSPLISILMPTYNTPIEVLDLAIASVVRQRYRNWELCVCDDGSSLPAVAERLDDWRKADSRIRVAYSERNEGISGASNRALRMAKGEFVGLLDHDDELTPDALLEVVSHLQRWPNADMVYSDEDRLDLSGRRTQPFLKPDWSPENLLCMMYTCHFGVYRKRVLDEIGGFRLGFEGAQDYDLVLRLAERTQNIHHIPKILYHWRMLPTSMAAQGANAKPYAFRAARKALNEHFVRRGISAEAAPGKWAGLYRVRFKLDGSDRVSIILPVAGDLGKVLTTVSNIRERTAYSNYEVVVVPCVALSPEQRQILLSMSCRIVGGPEAGGPIGLTNLGVSKAEGDFVLLLTDGAIEIAFRGWLDSMLGFCGMKDVGGVGAKLLASDRRIQHVGIVLGLGGLAGYPLRGMHQAPEHCPGPDPTFLIRNCSAVSSACMMVRKHVFQAVRGFDERLGFGYADVDLCMRIRDAGYRIVWTPDAELIVDGSLAAMTNDGAGAEYLRRKWQRVSQEDPYYNPNLTLQHEDLGFRA